MPDGTRGPVGPGSPGGAGGLAALLALPRLPHTEAGLLLGPGQQALSCPRPRPATATCAAFCPLGPLGPGGAVLCVADLLQQGLPVLPPVKHPGIRQVQCGINTYVSIMIRGAICQLPGRAQRCGRCILSAWCAGPRRRCGCRVSSLSTPPRLGTAPPRTPAPPPPRPGTAPALPPRTPGSGAVARRHSCNSTQLSTLTT